MWFGAQVRYLGLSLTMNARPLADYLPLSYIKDVMAQVRHRLGVDISRYAPGFISQVVRRRMSATAELTCDGYLRHLEVHADEAQTLALDLDVHHSALFRDPLAFAALEQRVGSSPPSSCAEAPSVVGRSRNTSRSPDPAGSPGSPGKRKSRTTSTPCSRS